MRDQLIEVFTMNSKNTQDYLPAFQDFVGTADENGSSSANITMPFSAAINLSAGAGGLFMVEGSDVFRLDFDPAEAWDLVCVMLGCEAPILLQPVLGPICIYYKVVGEVYATGIMNDLAMDHLRGGRKELQRFELG
jgi:hypothetical protein